MPWPLRTAPGVTLQVHGPESPSRPVAVLLHGVASAADFALRCLAAPLDRLGYDVVAPDLRGHAASTPLADPADHALDHHVADLAELAARVDVRLLAGISLGAEIALQWACANGADRLDGLLVCAPGIAGPVSAAAAANRATAVDLASYGVPAVLARLGDAAGPLPWVVDEVRASWSRHQPPSLIAALRAAAEAEPLSAADLAALDVPVGVVAFSDDAGHPVELAARLVATLPRAALETLGLADLAVDRSVLGRTALRALARTRS